MCLHKSRPVQRLQPCTDGGIIKREVNLNLTPGLVRRPGASCDSHWWPSQEEAYQRKWLSYLRGWRSGLWLTPNSYVCTLSSCFFCLPVDFMHWWHTEQTLCLSHHSTRRSPDRTSSHVKAAGKWSHTEIGRITGHHGGRWICSHG